MSERFTQTLERLRVLSAQLHAVTTVSATEDFHRWPSDVRDYYMWLMSDMTEEVKSTVQGMVFSYGDPEQELPIKKRCA